MTSPASPVSPWSPGSPLADEAAEDGEDMEDVEDVEEVEEVEDMEEVEDVEEVEEVEEVDGLPSDLERKEADSDPDEVIQEHLPDLPDAEHGDLAQELTVRLGESLGETLRASGTSEILRATGWSDGE